MSFISDISLLETFKRVFELAGGDLTILPTRDVPNIRVSDPNIRVGDPKIRVSVPNIRVTDPNIRVSVDEKF